MIYDRIDVERTWAAQESSGRQGSREGLSLSQLQHEPLVFLVGDPGSGKSDAVETFVSANASQNRIETFADAVSTSQVQTWLSQCFEAQSTLILDAYDERPGNFRRATLTKPLLAACRDGHCPKLRIVSREAHLPEDLVTDVCACLGIAKDSEIVYRIEPLTSSQIASWTDQRLGHDAKQFTTELRHLQLGDYARRPVDLEAFITSFKTKGTLGKSASEAWLSAIRHELTETNVDRKDPASEIGAKSTVEDRLQIAGLLAISQFLCLPKPILVDGITNSTSNQHGLTFEKLWAEASEAMRGQSKEYWHVVYRETVQSRFFEKGKDGIYFASATKGQFLAAQYLKGIPFNQLFSILKDKLEGVRIPEAAQVIAVEVAKFLDELFDWICTNQPDAFLKGVLFDFSEGQRKKIVHGLLVGRDRRHPWNINPQRFHSFTHPELASQLRPYLLGESGDEDDTNLAIDLTEHTSCVALIAELGLVTRKNDLQLRTRTNAAYALTTFGPLGANELRPLLSVELNIDEDDELFACALMGLWPDAFSLDQVFTVLRRPREVRGLYHGFLSYDRYAVSRLKPHHVIAGLKWMAESNWRQDGPRDEFNHLHLMLTKLAWTNIIEPGVADALAKIAQSRITQHVGDLIPFQRDSERQTTEGLDFSTFERDTAGRWKLFIAWVNLKNGKKSSFDVRRFVGLSEFECLISEALRRRGRNRLLLTEAVEGFVILLIRSKEYKRLKAVEGQIEKLGLKVKEIAKGFRQWKRKEARWNKPITKGNFDGVVFHQQLNNLVDSISVAKLDDLISLLTVDYSGYSGGALLKISSHARWQDLTENRRQRILDTSKIFILRGPQKAFDPPLSEIPFTDISAVRVLLLLADTDSEWMNENSPSVKPWLDLLAYYQNFDELNSHPISRIYSKLSSVDAASIIARQISHQASHDRDPFSVSRNDHLWSSEVGYVLAENFKSWPQINRARLLVLLVMQSHPAGELQLREDLRGDSFERREFALNLALRFGLTPLYPLISQLANSDQATYISLRNSLWQTRRIDPEKGVNEFDVAVLIRLFTDAVATVRPEDDVKFRSGSIVARWTQQGLRDTFASVIAGKISEEAQDFVNNWSLKPGFSWLRETAWVARQRWLESSWTPPNLDSVVRLTLSPNNRYMSTELDLHSVVLEVLEVLRPAVESQVLYWKDRNKAEPAPEPAITQNLALLLKPLLQRAIVNAEVSCNQGRTDIQVEAVVTDGASGFNSLKCVIEAKRCTNESLEKAIQDQLLGVYLQYPTTHTGVYLVFWFCARKQCRCERKVPICRILEDQARAAQTTVGVVHYHMVPRLASRLAPTATDLLDCDA